MTKYLLVFISFLAMSSCLNPMLENIQDMEGIWILSSTSGGFTGGGFDAPFNRLVIDEDFNFEVFDGTESVGDGKIKEKTSDTDDILVHFDGEKALLDVWVDIIDDGEKYVIFEGNDIMFLNAPCCDRYNMTWEKE